MKIVLHIGAHRCANTTFRAYLSDNRARLAALGIASWGPERIRAGLLDGALQAPSAVVPRRNHDPRRRCAGRVRLNLARRAGLGVRVQVVSDPSLPGRLHHILAADALYPAAGERLSRVDHAFGHTIGDVILNIRSQEAFWASALALQAVRAHRLPDSTRLDRIAASARSWRDVMADVACAIPGARLWVLPFETFAGRPELQLAGVTGACMPRTNARAWLNRAPRLHAMRALPGGEALPTGDGRWMPFDAGQRSALRESYADDIMWLRMGADGLAQLMDDPERQSAGTNPRRHDLTRGRWNEQESRLAGTGQG